MEHAHDTRLVRGIRRWDLVALVINSIIGAGIFGLPARVFALAGTYSLLAFVVAAAAIALVILCFAEVGSRFKATGGPYLYARSTFGPLVGFQVGWLLWLGRIAAFASLANLFVGYLSYFIPVVGNAVGRSAVMAVIISVLAAANIGGVRLTTTVTNALTIGKLVPLFVLIVVGAFFVDPKAYSLATPPSYGSFSQAALLLVFTYMGFEGAAIPTGEMRDPARHLPFALLSGMAVVTIVYVSIQIVCIGTLPDLARSDRPLADAGLRFLGGPGAALITVGALVSIGGTLNALMFATPRLLFAMGENHQLPADLSATHPGFRTPMPAILVTAAITLGLALFSYIYLGTHDQRNCAAAGIYEHLRCASGVAAQREIGPNAVCRPCRASRFGPRGCVKCVAALQQSVERDACRWDCLLFGLGYLLRLCARVERRPPGVSARSNLKAKACKLAEAGRSSKRRRTCRLTRFAADGVQVPS